MGLINDALAGDRRALARLLSVVEHGGPQAHSALRQLYARTGRAHLLGVTGPPGAGKSTLVNELALELRRRGQSVAIIAVDPSSPFTGGAILGDRIRMQPLAQDPRMFVRSMASRGQAGGIARATGAVVNVLDAVGFDVVIVETVGAGQAEVEIARQAQTVIVVEVPGLGDDIQAIKAGILEIADVFVVNKADRPDAGKTQRQLQTMLQLGHTATAWTPPILPTVATTAQGIAAVADAIAAHRVWLATSGVLHDRERARVQREILAILWQTVQERSAGALPALVARVELREIDPYAAADALMNQLDLNGNETEQGL